MKAPERLSGDHDLASFDCRNDDLNHWLRQRAATSEGVSARTFVVTDERRVVGYYTLAAGSVLRRGLPGRIRHNNPEQVPVILIARLAVDGAHKGKGLGRGMMKDALQRALSTSQSIGVRAVVVHAIDDDAAAFYGKLGFLISPLDPRTLALPIETIGAALD